ncbi:NMDA receptor synaptonuclear signaling and neuronal migration factor-like [Patiria miniata]|uniref:DUF4347 domain-containing protein n=1 Tax=Patiria miniata TaxID=46514 RepID=A0A914AKC7_PATMI|nr:NMDA receptor synaptonuclear signaling and neuronal migration factor-like [Patiria miniata]
MGSSPSKNKSNQKVSNVMTATFAFDDAANRAAEKRQRSNGDLAKTTDGVANRTEEPLQTNGVITSAQPETGEGAVDNDTEDELMLSHASTKIQSTFRGYKERKLRRQETEMAIKIQRIYRRHSSVKKSLAQDVQDSPSPEPEAAPTTPQSLQPLTEEQKVPDARPDSRLSKAKDSKSKAITKQHLVGVGQKTKEDFLAFQDEITELKWYAEQQLERAICGSEFVGPRIVLVSSKVPKGELLAKIVRKDVLIFVYDFNKDTYDVLLENIKVNLQAFKEGCKARSICLYCQGGPGYLYLRRGKVVTVAKLKKESEQDQVRFFKELGKYVTKIEAHKSVVHVMGCNVLGNDKGQELFNHLKDLMKPNQVRFEAPLELSEAGAEMIDTYFYFDKYVVWRAHKHSKLDPEL